MKGFSILNGQSLIGFAGSYRKAVAVADYSAKKLQTEILVESPNGTVVYHAKEGV